MKGAFNMRTGSIAYPLGQQIADTIAVHGEEWTRSYFLSAGVAAWEYNLLLAGALDTVADADFVQAWGA